MENVRFPCNQPALPPSLPPSLPPFHPGHYALNNVLGACLCVSMISFLRLPNLRIAAICLGSLFVYDIFW